MADGEMEMYEKVCEKRFSKLEGKVDYGFAEMTKKLFIGNGKKSVVALIEDNAGHIKDNRLNLKRHTEAVEGKSWLGFRFKPVESRDIPRIVGAVGILVLVLEKFGALGPVLTALAK